MTIVAHLATSTIVGTGGSMRGGEGRAMTFGTLALKLRLASLFL
jgi:hypothetical protein